MSNWDDLVNPFTTKAAPRGLATIFGTAVQQGARYEGFFERARALGLSTDQARWIAERERNSSDFSDLLWRLDERLRLVAENGWLVVTLDDVLTPDELIAQSFSARTPLNGRQWMQRTYGEHFAELKRDKQRGLTKAGIELALQTEWPLERAMAAVMPYVEGS